MTHTLWCAAYVTETEAAQGRTPGKCSCRSGTPRCERTVEMFESRGQSLEEFAEETPEEKRRELDIALLRELVEAGVVSDPDVGIATYGDTALSQDEHDAFEDMLERIERKTGRQTVLTDKQREWVERRASDLGLASYSPAARNAKVPRGREVELAVASMPKPAKSPGRR